MVLTLLDDDVMVITTDVLALKPTGISAVTLAKPPLMHLRELDFAGADIPPCSAPCPLLRPDQSAAVLTLLNQHRSAMGLPVLRIDARLQASAEWKALNMAALQYMQHDDPAQTGLPNGRTFVDRMAIYYPINRAACGENIAYGFVDAAGVMGAWLSDVPHRANIEGPWVGVGIAVAQAANGLIFWVQDFGSDALPVPPNPGDHTPPTTPTDLRVSNVTESSATVTWTASTDPDDDVKLYEVRIDGDLIGSSGVPSISFGGLKPGTTYGIGLVAVDYSGNHSGSASVSFTTSGSGPEPPPVPSGAVLAEWMQTVLPLVKATSQYQKWLASTTVSGKADVAAWQAFLAAPHGTKPSMKTPYGRALVADLALAAAQG